MEKMHSSNPFIYCCFQMQCLIWGTVAEHACPNSFAGYIYTQK